MISIRRIVYASVLLLTTLSFLPSLAVAQEPAKGRFTLSHAVRWQNAAVPAGDYRFSFEPGAAGGVLTLSKISGAPAGFLLLVRDREEAKPSDVSEIILATTSTGSYVSAMQLPEFGMTLHFAVAARANEKQIAKAGTPALGAAQ